MQIPHYALTLNVNAQKSTQTIIAKQHDNKSRYIDITLVADNKAIVPEKERVTLTVVDRKTQETIALTDCTIVDGVIVAELTAKSLSAATTLEFEITVYGTSSEILTSAKFNCIVDRKLSTQVVEREADFSALQKALSDVASTSNRIDEEAAKVRPVTLGGTGASNAYRAAQNLKTAYLGSVTTVPENEDLDTYKTSGTYDIAHASIATLSNSPFSAHSFKLYVVAIGASSYVTQIAISPYFGEICMREYQTGAQKWSDWNKIVSQPTSTDESGTWTPTVSGGTITVTNANYVYHGDTVMVTASLEIGEDIKGTSLRIDGLPLAAAKVSAVSVYPHATAPTPNFAGINGSYIMVRLGESFSGKAITVTGTYLV